MTTQALSAVGSTTPTPIIRSNTSIQLPPGIIVNLTAGASLTYSVQVTGDDITAASYNPATGIWNTFDTMGALTASANGTLTGFVTAVRCTITAYTSGTLTFQVAQ